MAGERVEIAVKRYQVNTLGLAVQDLSKARDGLREVSQAPSVLGSLFILDPLIKSLAESTSFLGMVETTLRSGNEVTLLAILNDRRLVDEGYMAHLGDMTGVRYGFGISTQDQMDLRVHNALMDSLFNKAFYRITRRPIEVEEFDILKNLLHGNEIVLKVPKRSRA